MRVVSWNIRGLGSAVKQRAVQGVVRQQKCGKVFLREMKLEVIAANLVYKVWSSDTFEFFVLPCEWFFRGQWVHEACLCGMLGLSAPCNMVGQVALWNDIRLLVHCWGFQNGAYLNFQELLSAQTASLEEVFSEKELLRGLNSSFIALVPKKESLLVVADYSNTQSAFIKGRQIVDEIFLVRQGDPLSPLLFVVVVEVFHQFMVWATNLGLVRGICVALEVVLTHLQFADDTMLFLRRDEAFVQNLQRILTYFQYCWGLEINFSKSLLFTVNVGTKLVDEMVGILGCSVGQLPFKYLGIPIGVNSQKVVVWELIIHRVRLKLAGWKRESLSFAARLVLGNSVLSAFPLYYMGIFVAMGSVIGRIDKIRRSFL
ncbi:hypothetical protein GQ457_08G034090 [Hibiscus cannabinus]